MYTPEDSPFEKFRTEKLKGVAMSPDVRELVAMAYESGFIDGMQKQMQSSVDRAVNRMAGQACLIENDHRGLIDIGRIFTPEKSAAQPAQQEQGDSNCQDDDGCPTEIAVLQRFWRGEPIPTEHYPAWFRPAQQQEPFGHVTVRRLSQRFENHHDQYHFYPAGQPPYLDNVDECHAVYVAPPVASIDTSKKRVEKIHENVHEPVDCCANCMRPKHEHTGPKCPEPFTTIWHPWDYPFPPEQRPTK